jgi:hypothetical protein
MLDEWVLAPGSYVDLKVFLPCVTGISASSTWVTRVTWAKIRKTLWERGEHLLLPLRRHNQQEQWPDGIQKILGTLRHRIETALYLRLPPWAFLHESRRTHRHQNAGLHDQLLPGALFHGLS